MNLKLLAISDTHLGEDDSLLSYPHGLQQLWSVLRENFGEQETFNVDELILLGDIPDRSLSSTSQIITCTNAFMDTMFSAANIRKIVYIPGNHDHTIWTRYCRQKYKKESGITGPKGDSVYERSSGSVSGEFNEEILNLFFGYPAGGAWNRIERDRIERDKGIDFVISNPIYHFKSNERDYVFFHGTHFRPEIAGETMRPTFQKFFPLASKIFKENFKDFSKVVNVKSLEELEVAIAPGVDSIWSSSMNNPTNLRDDSWHKVTKYREKLSYFQTKGRNIPSISSLFTWHDLNKKTPPTANIRILDENDKSIQRCNKLFLNLVLEYIYGDSNLKHVGNQRTNRDRLTFVFGDTHDGGWGELQNGKVRVYNCGCWVNHGKNNHPPCHIFAVGDDDMEYILDVSFDSVKLHDEKLLEIAASGHEHSRGLVRKFLQTHWPSVKDRLK